MLTLLFSWDYEPLGEFSFEDGRIKQMSLSPAGEVRLGALVRSWQTEGIRVRERQRKAYGSDESVEERLVARWVLLTDREAEQAFLLWVADEGYIARRVPARLMPYWEKLCRLALEPEERFASLHALLNASHDTLQTWDKAMDSLAEVRV